MYLKNKKAISEVTSFVLITFLVISASTVAYVFAKDLIDSKIIELDSTNMDIYLKKMYYQTNEVSSFDGSSVTIPVNFKTGRLYFVNNTIYYNSLKEFSGIDYCFEDICYVNNGGYEKKYINLSTPYQFSSNLSLSAGTYTLFFKNIKNESKISIQFK